MVAVCIVIIGAAGIVVALDQRSLALSVDNRLKFRSLPSELKQLLLLFLQSWLKNHITLLLSARFCPR